MTVEIKNPNSVSNGDVKQNSTNKKSKESERRRRRKKQKKNKKQNNNNNITETDNDSDDNAKENSDPHQPLEKVEIEYVTENLEFGDAYSELKSVFEKFNVKEVADAE
ncbi:hypothetical protein MKX01_015257, partial [Papaver californicum]